MEYIAIALVLLVAIEHVYILVLEMFLWTTPKALKVFGFSKGFAESTKALAANQGLYNGFLAAGLIAVVFTAGFFAAGFFALGVFSIFFCKYAHVSQSTDV